MTVRRRVTRPWRLTAFDARVVATYSSKERALARAKKLVDTGKAPRLWVHKKMSEVWIEVGMNVREVDSTLPECR